MAKQSREDEYTDKDRAAAYARAEEKIAACARDGETRLIFGHPDTHALTTLPPAIADLSALTILYLSDTQITDLGALSGLTGLQELWLNDTGVTDLGALSGLTGLQYLRLDNTGVTDLGALSGLTGLQRLYLGNTGVTDLGALSGLTGLQSLWLNDTAVTDLGALSGLTGLQTLSLAYTDVTDLGALPGLTGLQWLDLNRTKIREIRGLGGMPKLETLNVDGTLIESVLPLDGDVAIKRLDLNGMPVQRLDGIRNMPKLTTLNLGRTPIMAANPDLAEAYRKTRGRKRVEAIRNWVEKQVEETPEPAAASDDDPKLPAVLTPRWGLTEDNTPIIEAWAPVPASGRTTDDPKRQKAVMRAAGDGAMVLKAVAEGNRAHPQIAAQLDSYAKAVDRPADSFVPNTAHMLAAIVGGLIKDNEDTPEAVTDGFKVFLRTHRQLMHHFPALEDFQDGVDAMAFDPDQMPDDVPGEINDAFDSAEHMIHPDIKLALDGINHRLDTLAKGQAEHTKRGRKSALIALVSVAVSVLGVAADTATLGGSTWAAQQVAPMIEALRGIIARIRDLFR